MAEKKTWWQSHKPTPRRLTQLYAALLYNAHLKGFAEGKIYQGQGKALCVPGLNCYSCPGAVGACPLGALQNALNASGRRAPWYVLGILLLFGLALGRVICGWLCPVGLIQELLHKIPTPKIRKGRITRALSWLKYGVLAVFVVAIPLWAGLRNGIALPGFCKYICPAGTLEGAVGLLASEANADLFGQLGLLFTQKWVIMLLIGLCCVFCYRSFCRFLCPLGAIYGFFSKIAWTGVKVAPDQCVGCGACVNLCPMDVKSVGDRECISCGRCIGACPCGAISLKCGKLTLKGPEAGKNVANDPAPQKRRRLMRALGAAALALLVFFIVWLNVLAPGNQPPSPPGAADDSPGDLPLGFEAGNQLPDFTAPLLDGGTFRLSEHRGQTVFINLWATFCKPCVEELPYFERLKAEHPEIEILAVHSGLFTPEKEVMDFLDGKGWDHIHFALDSQDQALFSIVNGSTVLPQTIVLNPRGEVIFNEKRSVTWDMLNELLRQASGK